VLIAESVVHPIARAALLGTDKARALNLKLDADQGVEVHAPGKHIAARELRPRSGQIQLTFQRLDYFRGEERDLTLVVGL